MPILSRGAMAVLPLALGLALAAPATPSLAAEPYALTIRDHRFDPERLTVPAGKQVRLEITNADATPEEFESHELNSEKVIPGGSTTTLLIGPLDAGEYAFFGEFHEDTAQGTIVAE